MKTRYALLLIGALVAVLLLPWPRPQSVPSAQSPAATAESIARSPQRSGCAELAPTSLESAGVVASDPNGAEVPASPTAASETETTVPAEKLQRSQAQRRHSSPELEYLASQQPAEALVLEEEENGNVTYQADPASLGQDRLPVQLQEVSQKADNEAAVDLLAQFQSEPNAEGKLAILSASSLLQPDDSTGQLLAQALSSGQPQEVRIAALAFLADQAPSMLANYVADPDSDVAVEAQSAIDSLNLPEPATAASPVPPCPRNLARPPENINYAPIH